MNKRILSSVLALSIVLGGSGVASRTKATFISNADVMAVTKTVTPEPKPKSETKATPSVAPKSEPTVAAKGTSAAATKTASTVAPKAAPEATSNEKSPTVVTVPAALDLGQQFLLAMGALTSAIGLLTAATIGVCGVAAAVVGIANLI